ncbi:Ubiquinone/menaquinone biosynthesis C-methylase UbiE [Pilibacter termitis]|uniref:Ubiquinone/menaquinone biosynthesis C-methylase UbiE n=1 Tax=Pilibacter termitis TaxID=263852 RepID=A0A1T4M743_9ENTE|nr:methyltransferase domain-containing protein [Pilibacter termitis]SJZ62544.1 Ubiquinone/menaquinone biosynthesis C-methylase UbiE [Pilibacter termitis]
MMKKKKKNHVEMSRQHYNKHAVKFDRSMDGLFSAPFKQEIVRLAPIENGDVVLDVGCANGKLLTMLKERHQGMIGVGLDISEEMIRVAREKHPEFTFECANAEKLPFDNGTFDWVICSASFHHFPAPKEFLKEAIRVLKPAGKLLIAEIHFPKVTLPAYNFYIEKFNKEGDVRIYSPQQLKMMLAESGFHVLGKTNYRFQVQAHMAMKPEN